MQTFSQGFIVFLMLLSTKAHCFVYTTGNLNSRIYSIGDRAHINGGKANGGKAYGYHSPNFQTNVKNRNLLHQPSAMALFPEMANSLMSDFSITGNPITVTLVERNDLIQQAFNVANFGPQIFWLFLILLPNAKITKQLMGDYKVILFFALVHFAIVVLSASEPNGTAPIAQFADVFDPAGNPQEAMVGMMKYPNFVSEEWSHVLTWDLLVGRWVWLDGLRRGIFTSHSVLFCNLIGPPGFLLHALTCLVTGKEFIGGNEALEISLISDKKENETS